MRERKIEREREREKGSEKVEGNRGQDSGTVGGWSLGRDERGEAFGRNQTPASSIINHAGSERVLREAQKETRREEERERERGG